MGLGIYALVDSDSLKDFIHIIDSDLDVNLFGLAGGLIVGVSLIIAAIAFFGCCGAVKVRMCFGIISRHCRLIIPCPPIVSHRRVVVCSEFTC